MDTNSTPTVEMSLEVLSEVEGVDEGMIRLAERLRDAIAHRLPRTEEQSA